MAAEPGLRQLLAEDFRVHYRNPTHPGFHALAVHRIGVWARELPQPLKFVVVLWYRIVNNLIIRNLYGIEIYSTTVIGRRVKIGHHMGVLLGRHTVIGDDCLIRQNATLGVASDDVEHTQQPRLGNRVEIGAGAVLAGGITIGDGAKIGPNAIVLTDVPAGATVFAPPARVLRRDPPPSPAPPAGSAPTPAPPVD